MLFANHGGHRNAIILWNLTGKVLTIVRTSISGKPAPTFHYDSMLSIPLKIKVRNPLRNCAVDNGIVGIVIDKSTRKNPEGNTKMKNDLPELINAMIKISHNMRCIICLFVLIFSLEGFGQKWTKENIQDFPSCDGGLSFYDCSDSLSNDSVFKVGNFAFTLLGISEDRSTISTPTENYTVIVAGDSIVCFFGDCEMLHSPVNIAFSEWDGQRDFAFSYVDDNVEYVWRYLCSNKNALLFNVYHYNIKKRQNRNIRRKKWKFDYIALVVFSD